VTQPGKYSKVGLFRKEMEAATSDVDKSYTPDYFRRLFAIPTPFRLGGKTMYWNPDLPFQDIQLLGDPRDIIGMLTPAAKVPIEMLTNKSLFFGTPIARSEYWKREAPTYLQLAEYIPGLRDILGMERIKAPYDPTKETVGMNPYIAYLFEQIPFMQNISKWTAWDTRPGEKVLADIMSGAGGAKFFPYDPERERERVGWENVRNYQDFMEQLKRQHGISIPSKKTLMDYLAFAAGRPLPETSGGGITDTMKQLGIDVISPADIAAFQQAVAAGSARVPSERDWIYYLRAMARRMLHPILPESAYKKTYPEGDYLRYLMETLGFRGAAPEDVQSFLRAYYAGLYDLSPGRKRTHRRTYGW